MPTTTTGLATSFITFSRPGASGGGATVTDADGKIKWAGHNLLTNSESFDASAWVKTNANSTTPAVTANAAAAPNSTTTADKVDFGAVDATNDYSVMSHTFSSDASSYTAGAWLKAVAAGDVGKKVWLYLNDGSIKGLLAVTLTADWQYAATTATLTAGSGRSFYFATLGADYGGSNQGAVSVYAWGAHLYRSDLGGMQQNPAMGAGMGSYYPTSVANRLGYTETFSNAAWVALNGGAAAPTKGTVSGTKPNGLTATIDTLTIPAVSAGQWSAIYQNAGATFANVPITFSVYARVSSGTATIYLNVEDIGAGPSAGNFIASTAKTLDSTWQRISVTGTRTSTTGNAIVVIGFDTRCGAGQTNASSITVELWGAQLSDSASLDTYVPVYGAAVTSAAYYAPRLDFDGATLAARGLLVEELRSNLATYSDDFSNAAWAKIAGGTAVAPVVTANNSTSPDGTSNADLVVFDAGSNGGSDQSLLQGAAFSATAQPYTFSVWLKTSDSSTKTVQLSISGAGALVVTVTGAWQRFSTTWTATAGTWNPRIVVGGGVTSATASLHVYGAQLEAGSFATSYIPTGSATATRAADVASVSTQAFPYSASASSLVLAATVLGESSGNALLELSASAAASRLLVYQSSGLLRLNAYVDPSSVILGNATVGTVQKVGIAYDGAANGAVLNGGTVSSVGTTVSAAATKLSIGTAFNNSAVMNGHIRQITYLPRRISNAELQQRTSV